MFRPDLEVGPALSLDSFIFANGELVVDQSKTETAFPPIFAIDAPQDCGWVVVEPAPGIVNPAVLIAAGDQIVSSPPQYQPVAMQLDSTETTWSGAAIDILTATRQRYGGWYDQSQDIWVLVGRSVFNIPIIYSNDGTVSWAAATPTVTGTDQVTVVSDGAGTWISAGDAGIVHRSTDGINWTQIENATFFGSQNFQDSAWDATGNRFILVSSSTGGIWTSDSTGTTWTALGTEPGNDLYRIGVNGSRWFTSDWNGNFWYSDTSGASWNQTIAGADWSGFPGIVSFGINTTDNNLFAVEDGSSLNQQKFSNDNGATWSNVSQALAVTSFWDCEWCPGYGFIASGLTGDEILVVSETTGLRTDWQTGLTVGVGGSLGENTDKVIIGPI